MGKTTPMMEQYFQIKKNYKHCLLFFRLGDFYEMFFDDALVASKELEITLTGKDWGQKERAPMCGVPFHSAENVIERLAESFWISYSLLSANSKDGNIIRDRIPDGARHIYCQYIYKIKLLVSELQAWEKWLKLPTTTSPFNEATYKLDTILASIANCSENNIHESLLYIEKERDSFSEPVNNAVGRDSWLQFWSAALSSRPWLKPFYVMALLSSKSCIHELPAFVTDFFEMLLEDFEYSDACISDYVPSINELRS